MMNYQEVPKVHPEMFDQNGNLVPDDIVAFRFETIMTTTKTTTREKTVKTVKAKSSSTAIPVLPNMPFAYEVFDAFSSKEQGKLRCYKK